METIKNDDKILLLREKIEEEELKLTQIRNYTPKTNRVLDYYGATYNLNTLNSKDAIIQLMVRLNMDSISAKDLGVFNDYRIGKYSIQDWIDDLKWQLEKVTRIEKEKELKTMKHKLEQLLSNEKKTELAVDEIAKLLEN